MASGGPFPGLAGNGEVMLHITFHPPTKRRYDLDGLLTRCKPLLDGFADAIEVNDYRFAMTIRRADPVAGGQVVIEIAP
jgi:crossover junction endodeoxyribonuclease RusA